MKPKGPLHNSYSLNLALVQRCEGNAEAQALPGKV
jgi:hypothetical protein